MNELIRTERGYIPMSRVVSVKPGRHHPSANNPTFSVDGVWITDTDGESHFSTTEVEHIGGMIVPCQPLVIATFFYEDEEKSGGDGSVYTSARLVIGWRVSCGFAAPILAGESEPSPPLLVVVPGPDGRFFDVSNEGQSYDTLDKAMEAADWLTVRASRERDEARKAKAAGQ